MVILRVLAWTVYPLLFALVKFAYWIDKLRSSRRIPSRSRP